MKIIKVLDRGNRHTRTTVTDKSKQITHSGGADVIGAARSRRVRSGAPAPPCPYAPQPRIRAHETSPRLQYHTSDS
ncbi:jg22208 [Pararge aegeria aegeria]|uniref:Jg22208 protein n=1 Tax=Pararge aegeria aegeria TaxID=348720 RepID=A0A8S4QFP4_9NEOP|nr:jg22208 [Pararge aegeria aegeria]